MLWVTLWVLWSVAGGYIAYEFIKAWGWGDASWDDPLIHPGTPDDAWHIRRRRWFYLVAFWACAMNPVMLVLFGLKRGRAWFRSGVMEASPATHKRWYG